MNNVNFKVKKIELDYVDDNNGYLILADIDINGEVKQFVEWLNLEGDNGSYIEQQYCNRDGNNCEVRDEVYSLMEDLEADDKMLEIQKKINKKLEVLVEEMDLI
ncbi:MAG: hypothetical protein GY861_26220 [bacterium]|nr:hypothetical protein [bacterium]